jgi:zinc/manganese transport system permease protein
VLDLILVPFAAALVILAINAYFGLHIIRRGVIFVDLAFAQIAALGATVAFLSGAEPDSLRSYLFAFGATLAGALFFSLTRTRDDHVSQEAYIGISYVVASAAVILLSSFSPEGAEHVKETLTGSLIWVTWPTVAKMAAVYALIALFHWVVRNQMIAVTFAPQTVCNAWWWVPAWSVWRWRVNWRWSGARWWCWSRGTPSAPAPARATARSSMPGCTTQSVR